MLLQAIQVSGADNSNDSSNLDTSLKFGKKQPYVKINHELFEPFKMAAIFKMAAKKFYCTSPCGIWLIKPLVNVAHFINRPIYNWSQGSYWNVHMSVILVA